MEGLNCSFEYEFWSDGLCVAGIDEAGRGALAGPVVAAAVILPSDYSNNLGINDSKLISAKRREILYRHIIETAKAYSIGIVDNETIDSINILQATFMAMNLAVESLAQKPDHLLIDGNRFSGSDIEYTTIIDGDAKCLSIAAASIIAKVTRDRIMDNDYHPQYNIYGFNKNKGYGTKQHLESIDKFGICPIHRKTFLKKHFERQLIQSLEF